MKPIDGWLTDQWGRSTIDTLCVAWWLNLYAFHLSWLIFLYVMTDGLNLGPVPWVQSFNQWDARWYASIGMNGHGFLPQTFVFAPAHGWFFGSITEVFFQVLWAADLRPKWVDVFSFVSIILNFLCYVIANIIVVRLAEKRFRKFAISRPRLWLLALSNPVGYFALTPYSDIVFYLITMMTLLLVIMTSPRAEAWGLLSYQQNLRTGFTMGVGNNSFHCALVSSHRVRLCDFWNSKTERGSGLCPRADFVFNLLLGKNWRPVFLLNGSKCISNARGKPSRRTLVRAERVCTRAGWPGGTRLRLLYLLVRFRFFATGSFFHKYRLFGLELEKRRAGTQSSHCRNHFDFPQSSILAFNRSLRFPCLPNAVMDLAQSSVDDT
jgi:hypothetical protein